MSQTGIHTDVLIIGAGPAGLAASAVLGKAGIRNRIFEQSGQVGGAYAKVHPSLYLLTTRDLVTLPLGTKIEAGDRITAGEYLEYLKTYKREQGIQIEHGITVVRVHKAKDNFVLTDQDDREYRSQFIVVATGMLGFPKPLIDIRERYPQASYFEAADWKGVESCSGKTVLVVGSGISASELAVALSEKCRVFLAARGKMRTVPLRILGVPIQKWMMPLERLPKAMLPMICSDKWREPLLNVGLQAAIKRGKVTLGSPDSLELGFSVDVIINATGYLFDTSILPEDIQREEQGQVHTKNNESISHPGLFLIGYPCAGGVDSKYLRGIRRDAVRILQSIERHLGW